MADGAGGQSYEGNLAHSGKREGTIQGRASRPPSPFQAWVVTGWGRCGLRSRPLDLTDHSNTARLDLGAKEQQEPHHLPGSSWTPRLTHRGVVAGRLHQGHFSESTQGSPARLDRRAGEVAARPPSPLRSLHGAHSPTAPSSPFPIHYKSNIPAHVRPKFPTLGLRPRSPRTQSPAPSASSPADATAPGPQRGPASRQPGRGCTSQGEAGGLPQLRGLQLQACAPAAGGLLEARRRPGAAQRQQQLQPRCHEAKLAARTHARTDALTSQRGEQPAAGGP